MTSDSALNINKYLPNCIEGYDSRLLEFIFSKLGENNVTDNEDAICSRTYTYLTDDH